ncbi:TIGR03088 family PEP-CTERM/XrtA system glycosyltransferase [Catenovulum sediminis]|uniref:TIGR03088 family PEP-CTERM/XrtA system glycosyltransferase n=1 Tax=Catenovulum sediminis TaxID=1740262 RepID=A0ABV1RG11_9ALTE
MRKTNAKKHIVHLVYRLDIGGLERVLVNSINALPATEYQHSIIALTDYSKEFSALLEHEVSLHALHKPEGHSWKIFYQVWRLLFRLRADIVHSYNLPTLEYQLCSLLAGVPKRLHAEHGRDIYDPEGKNKKYRLLRQLMSPFVDKFIAVSDDLYQWLLKTVNIAPSKCCLIYNGVDTDKFSPAKQKSRLDERQQDKFVFGCVGRLHAIKDHKLLISAFTLACQQSTEFKQQAQLSIVGDGPLKNELQQQIEQAQLQQHIWLVGARHDMQTVYHAFDVFVMSSKGEGVPMTMLEAMACGLPVVSTHVGGIPEITNEKNAILVPPQDQQSLACALLEIFEQRENLQHYKDESRKLAVDEFSEINMIRLYQATYR